MKQVFRLMGMPDKMIAFDELPQDLLEGLEMSDESRMQRHWREYLGLREKAIRIPPDRDPLTGAVRHYTPIIQKAPFTYVIDREVNKDKERWQEIESYVKRNAPKDFRLLDKLEDMAKPMAADAHSEVTLEPEDIVVIPLGKLVEVDSTLSTIVVDTSAPAPKEEVKQKEAVQMFSCDACEKSFDTNQGLLLHKRKRHAEVKA